MPPWTVFLLCYGFICFGKHYRNLLSIYCRKCYYGLSPKSILLSNKEADNYNTSEGLHSYWRKHKSIQTRNRVSLSRNTMVDQEANSWERILNKSLNLLRKRLNNERVKTSNESESSDFQLNIMYFTSLLLLDISWSSTSPWIPLYVLSWNGCINSGWTTTAIVSI